MTDWARATVAKEIKVWSVAMICVAAISLMSHAFDGDSRGSPVAANPTEQVTQ